MENSVSRIPARIPAAGEAKPTCLVTKRRTIEHEGYKMKAAMQIDGVSKEDIPSLVFQNTMILEEIIRYVIVTPTKNIDKSAAKTLRLVSKRWEEGVTSVLHKEINRSPFSFLIENKALFTLSSHSGNVPQDLIPRDGEAVNPADSVLSAFLLRFVNNPDLIRSFDQLPPFKIISDGHFFTVENQPKLVQILKHCGSGLVELQILANGFLNQKLSLSRAPMPATLYLPHLKTLHLEVEQLSLIHGLLTGARHLRSLNMTLGRRTVTSLRNVLLPSSLEEITVRFGKLGMGGDLAALFHKNRFPMLTVLKIMSSEGPCVFPTGVMADVLKGVAGTLQTLILQNVGSGRGTSLSFSKPMQYLRYLEIVNWNLYDKGRAMPRLDHIFPNMTTCKWTITKGQLGQWMRRSTSFQKVRRLQLEMVEEGKGSTEPFCPTLMKFQNLNGQQVQTLQVKFRNVMELTISVCGSTLEGIRSIFMEMNQLKKLEIRVHYDKITHSQTSPAWDALFIGVTPRKSVQFRSTYRETATKGNWQDFGGIQYIATAPAITNLWNLTSLTLSSADEEEKDWNSSKWRYDESNPQFLTDISFSLSFFKLRHLKHLAILLNKACCHISENVLQEWEKLKKNKVRFEEIQPPK